MMADSIYAELELLHMVRHCVTMITPLRLDAALAALYEPAPPRTLSTMGRPRHKGQRLPTLQALLDDPVTPWQRRTIASRYGNTERQVDIVTGTSMWYHGGMPVVPLRWVLVRDI